MLKFEKIVPTVAMTLAIAGMTSVSAFASDAEAMDTPVDPTPAAEPAVQVDAPSADTQSEDRSSATIDNVVRDEPRENEDGSTTTTVTVNPEIKVEEDEEVVVNKDGTLDVTTQPGETTEETKPSGDSTVEIDTDTVTNADGSTTTTTTTTTTTPTETTTTTTEETDITGSIDITTPETSEPSDEEKEEIKDEVKDELDSVEENGSYDWDKFEQNIKDKYDNATVTHEDKKHTVTFTTSDDPSDGGPLSTEDLSKVLGVELSYDEANGTYSYVKDGQTVTVNVTKNSSTETTTTTWTVTVTETEQDVPGETVNGSVDVDGGVIQIPGTDTPTPLPDGDVDEDSSAGESVWDIIDEANAAGASFDKRDENGCVTFQKGNDTYTIKYTEETEVLEGDGVNLTGMSDEDIYNMLLDGKGFELKDDGVYKDGYKVTFTTDGSTITAKFYTIEVNKVTYTPPTQGELNDAESTVKENAEKDAMRNAIEKAIGGTLTDEQKKAIKDAVEEAYKAGATGGKYTVKVDGKDYTVTVDSSTVDVWTPGNIRG